MLRVPGAMLDVIEDRLDDMRESWFPEIAEFVAVYADFPEDYCARQHTVKTWTTAYLDGESDVEEDISELFQDHTELLHDVNDAIADLQEQRYVKRYQDEEMNDGEVEGEPATAVEALTVGWEGVELPNRSSEPSPGVLPLSRAGKRGVIVLIRLKSSNVRMRRLAAHYAGRQKAFSYVGQCPLAWHLIRSVMDCG